jgi:hypothetical protein
MSRHSIPLHNLKMMMKKKIAATIATPMETTIKMPLANLDRYIMLLNLLLENYSELHATFIDLALVNSLPISWQRML